MLKKIFSEWSQFCRNMGSTIIEFNDVVIARNNNTVISCDFANCMIALNPMKVFGKDSKTPFDSRTFTLYEISELNKKPIVGRNPDKLASLLVLSKIRWEKQMSQPQTNKKENKINYQISTSMFSKSLYINIGDFFKS